jgi:hypothetical protein
MHHLITTNFQPQISSSIFYTFNIYVRPFQHQTKRKLTLPHFHPTTDHLEIISRYPVDAPQFRPICRRRAAASAPVAI